MQVIVGVGEAGMGVDDAIIVGDVTKTIDVAVGSCGVGPVQLANPSTMNSNVRLGAMKCNRMRIFFKFLIPQGKLTGCVLLSFVH